MHRHFLCLLSVWLLGSAPAGAQTSVNPDISVIPRFVLSTNDGERLSEGVREWSRPEVSF